MEAEERHTGQRCNAAVHLKEHVDKEAGESLVAQPYTASEDTCHTGSDS